MRDVYINSLGFFLPGDPVPNAEIEDYIGRIGGTGSRYKSLVLRQNRIKTRHYALGRDGKPRYTSAQMAVHAANDALAKSETTAKDVTYLASAATLGDLLVPGLASHVHAGLKLPPIEIANFQSVCASALMAIKSAWLQLRCGEHDAALVTGSEFASRYFRPGFYEATDFCKDGQGLTLNADFLRFTLSDGAGAAVLESRTNTHRPSLKIKWIDIRSFADRFDTCMQAGGAGTGAEETYWSHFDSPHAAVKAGAFVLMQDFELMKRMLPVWVSHYLDLIDDGRIAIDKIDHVVSHYSSHSLREETIALLKSAGAMIDEDKWFSNLYAKGNTGTASIFILLEELFHSGRLQRGETILCHVPESGRALNGFMLLEVI
ncbi:MAG TPA: 3-oxoacyl-[acyl-carrier-protein] synthase III C-terminal domain-containing protein [Alphaproteobacteria bacterium]|nr:3-oxoacyl-[acyl-carrier-protein] synthase III C-terminal domain-containing protein [Alphaproteobacteria bacterium]